jgi:hypothetical protein
MRQKHLNQWRPDRKFPSDQRDQQISSRYDFDHSFPVGDWWGGQPQEEMPTTIFQQKRTKSFSNIHVQDKRQDTKFLRT